MRSGKFGVTITRGAVPWQIFQQGPDGTAVIRLEGEYHLVHLSQELPLSFSDVPDAPATVKARVALERTGESVIPWTVCDITAPGRWTVTFPAVPAGGLYRVETYMEYEGWDGLSCTRGDMVHHIGVGDVFVIAGQSNAAGRAKGPVDDAPSQMVHVLRPYLATHPLGETTGAVHIGNYENHNPGHSPWLHFAKMLNRALGYPIGLVPTAYGGSPLRWWDPAENGALTDNMLDILADYDLHPKAVLWVQGEAEGYENSAGTYLRRFAAFVDAVRRRLGQPDLRFFTVQINRCMEGPGEVLDRQWGIVRQAQRQAAGEIPGGGWPFPVLCGDEALFSLWGVATARSPETLGGPHVQEAIARAKAAGFVHGTDSGSPLRLPARFLVRDGALLRCRDAAVAEDLPDPADVLADLPNP